MKLIKWLKGRLLTRGNSNQHSNQYYIGTDIGPRNDLSAIVICENHSNGLITIKEHKSLNLTEFPEIDRQIQFEDEVQKLVQKYNINPKNIIR